MCPLVVQVGAIYVAEHGAKHQHLFIDDFIHKLRVGFREVGMYLPAVLYLIYLGISSSTEALGTEYSAPTTSQSKLQKYVLKHETNNIIPTQLVHKAPLAP